MLASLSARVFFGDLLQEYYYCSISSVRDFSWINLPPSSWLVVVRVGPRRIRLGCCRWRRYSPSHIVVIVSVGGVCQSIPPWEEYFSIIRGRILTAFLVFLFRQYSIFVFYFILYRFPSTRSPKVFANRQANTIKKQEKKTIREGGGGGRVRHRENKIKI